MHQTIFFSNEKEEKVYLAIRHWRDKLLQPFCAVLAKRNVSPDTVSYCSLVMLLFFVYFFSFNPWISFLFLLANLFCDMLDGALARYTHRESLKGDLLDHAIDNVSFYFVMLTFIAFGMVNSFLGAVYLLNHLINVFLMVILNFMKVKYFFIIRSKNVFYLAFLIWLLSGMYLFDPLLVFFAIYLFISNLFLFQKLRWTLS